MLINISAYCPGEESFRPQESAKSVGGNDCGVYEDEVRGVRAAHYEPRPPRLLAQHCGFDYKNLSGIFYGRLSRRRRATFPR